MTLPGRAHAGRPVRLHQFKCLEGDWVTERTRRQACPASHLAVFACRLTTVQPGNDPPNTSIRSHLVNSRPPARVLALRNFEKLFARAPHNLLRCTYYIPLRDDSQPREVLMPKDEARSYRLFEAGRLGGLCILPAAAYGSRIGGEMPRTFDVSAPFGLSGPPSRVVAAHTLHRTVEVDSRFRSRSAGRRAACQERFPSD